LTVELPEISQARRCLIRTVRARAGEDDGSPALFVEHHRVTLPCPLAWRRDLGPCTAGELPRVAIRRAVSQCPTEGDEPIASRVVHKPRLGGGHFRVLAQRHPRIVLENTNVGYGAAVADSAERYDASSLGIEGEAQSPHLQPG
jgi:hypothetical protein